jgi:hypothetical protein
MPNYELGLDKDIRDSPLDQPLLLQEPQQLPYIRLARTRPSRDPDLVSQTWF